MNRQWAVAVGLSVVAAVMAAPGATAIAQGQRFPDVPADHYASEAVEWAAAAGVTTGYNDGTFKPQRPLNKRHAVVFMERYYDEILQADQSEDFTRGDMMVLLKAINDGTLRGTDAPRDPAPRASGTAQGQRFPDVPADHYASEAVEWAAAAGVTTGYNDGTFKPQRPLNKRHAVVFMERYYDEILQADQSEDFTRGDMMVLLKAINDGTLRRTDSTPTGVGTFTALTAGSRHSCGLSTDNTITCWGDKLFGQADPPTGTFTALTAGRRHTCGLSSNGTITCWGSNRYAQADPPTGTFTALTAGSRHTCGLRTDNTITCWGDNEFGQADPPTGTFTAVTAGGSPLHSHSCGLRTDGTITCWGDNRYGQADAPSGRFEAVTAGGRHTCGLRSNDTISCWGDNRYGQADPPTGTFTAVTAGGSSSYSHSCGLRTDGTITCWGSNEFGQSEPPAGQFTAIDAGEEHSCALRVADMTIACWGDEHRSSSLPEAPEGSFSAVSMSDQWNACGLRTDMTIACWGRNDSGQSDPPAGQFTAIDVRNYNACGLRTDKTIACWGDNLAWVSEPPTGRFDAIDGSCGLRTDKTITCWGPYLLDEVKLPDGRFDAINGRCGLRTDKTITCWQFSFVDEIEPSEGQFDAIDGACGLRTDKTIACWGQDSDPPAGQFTAIDVQSFLACGLRTDKTIACWGLHGGGIELPEGQFSAITVGNWHACGLRTDKTIACWGRNDSGQSDPPAGQFTSVALGQNYTCGVRASKSIACWGSITPPPPIGVEHVPLRDGPNPDACRAGGPSGFPRDRFTPSTGTVKVAVLFVDFPDAPATLSTRQTSSSELRLAEQYLEASSYGKLDLEFVPLHRWLRAEHPLEHYIRIVDDRQQVVTHDEAARLADEEFDFAGHNILLAVNSGFGGLATSWGGPETGERHFQTVSDVGASGDGWGGTAAHELAHNLGLNDYYPYNAIGPLLDSDHYRVFELVAGDGFSAGIMGFTVFSPDSHPGHSLLEMLAWSRWQLGWIDADQIRCITVPQATVALSPVADPGDGIAMAAIPVSWAKTVVIESRRMIGYDDPSNPAPYRVVLEDGSVIERGLASVKPTTSDGGVLVYTVDAARDSGFLPIKGAGLTPTEFAGESPFLRQGDSIVVQGYRIALESDDGATHFVSITKLDNTGRDDLPSVSSSAPAVVRGPFDIQVTFSEPITGFEQDEIIVIDGSVQSFSGSGREYTATIAPLEMGEVVDVLVSVAPGAVTYGNGRPNRIPPPLVRQFDTWGPTVALSTSAPEIVEGAFDVRIVFSEPVTGLEENDIMVENGVVRSLTGSGREYIASILPDDRGDQLHVYVSVAPGAAHDSLGRPNRAHERLEQESASVGRPTVTITSSAPEVVEGSFDVRITFSAPVTRFDRERIVVINGTVTSFSGSGRVYDATILPGTESSAVLVLVPPGAGWDSEDRPNKKSDLFCRPTDSRRLHSCPSTRGD